MNLVRFPRRRYHHGATPIEPLDRLTELLGGPRIFIKRDDLLHLAGGGSKTRKLEFLVADALVRGADTLITGGAVQSNHCRLTLAAAVKENLACRLVLEERVPGSYQPDAGGNNLLFRLLRAEKITVIPGGSDMEAALEAEARQAREEGRNPYLIPVGGSNALGDLGYMACALEITAQAFAAGTAIDTVVCATGSGGTQSGLVAGFAALGGSLRVVGIDVVRPRLLQEERVYRLAQEAAAFAGIRAAIPREAVVCYDEYLGPGYSLPTPEMASAVRLLASTEGILLDPCYTGKAMAGLIDLVKRGAWSRNQGVLFLHTGGLPALYVGGFEALEGSPPAGEAAPPALAGPEAFPA